MPHWHILLSYIRQPVISGQTFVESLDDLFLIHLLTDEHEFFHAVAVLVVPLSEQVWIILENISLFLLRCRSDPETRLLEILLSAGLLEHVGHVILVAEIDHALASDYIAFPLSRGPSYELVAVESASSEIDES